MDTRKQFKRPCYLVDAETAFLRRERRSEKLCEPNMKRSSEVTSESDVIYTSSPRIFQLDIWCSHGCFFSRKCPTLKSTDLYTKKKNTLFRFISVFTTKLFFTSRNGLTSIFFRIVEYSWADLNLRCGYICVLKKKHFSCCFFFFSNEFETRRPVSEQRSCLRYKKYRIITL